MHSGIVTNIQRFSIHDGPGIRTTVFLKGCNLRCFWCHNPETLRTEPEIQIFPDRCIGCGACLERCEQHAHVAVDGQRQFLRERCVACGRCADTCYAESLVLVGEYKTVDEVVEEVLRDEPFYARSGGGITLSGGEPMLQFEYALEILMRSKAQGLHTAIETAANYSWERLAAVLPFTDLVMMDIKLLDNELHRACTGVRNQRILDNAERLGREDKPLIIRTPVVPGVNDCDEQILPIASFVARLPNLLYYELLPFHPMATGKYQSLDMDYRASQLQSPPKEQMEALADAARRAGIEVKHS
jgi:pyruvate formate lyase activating enzyme